MARGVRARVMRLGLLGTAMLALLGASLPASASANTPWLVGFAKESVDPRPCPAPDPSQPCDLNSNFHLGGFGLGPTRVSIGPLPLPDGTTESIYARAMAISNHRGQTLLLADIENQGMFAAYKQGPYGLWDIREQVSKDTGVPVEDIVINTDHSHAGPDMIGLWGGVPVSYLQLVRDQAIKALDEAYRNRVPASLYVGTDTPRIPDPSVGGYVPGTATPGETMDHSQFGVDTGPITTAQGQGLPVPNPPAGVPNGGTGYRDDLVDTQLRVLQAYDASGQPLGTLINYAAHADVMGAGNLYYSADWPGMVADATEQALGEPVALTMPADVGRTQPPRPISDPKCGTQGHILCSTDALMTWTRLFTPFVLQAVQNAVPVRGRRIASREIFTREVVTNPVLLGVSYSGEAPARGFGAYRAGIAPWLTGDVLGTFVSVHRIGDLLLTANPGEAYPDIRDGLLKEIGGYQAAFTFGLANDQLGYLIAPASEYPWITYANPGNDNSFFNISINYGDHDYCTQVAAARRIGFFATPNPQPYGPDALTPRCAVLTASDVAPQGPSPQQPWPFGDGIAAPFST
jgi:hypothetical protein